MKIKSISYKSTLVENKKAKNIVPFKNGYSALDPFKEALFAMGIKF